MASSRCFGWKTRRGPRREAEEKRRRYQEEFANDFLQLSQQASLGSNDIVLFVTINELELIAFCSCLLKVVGELAAVRRWNFQFHFDPIDPDRPGAPPDPLIRTAFEFAGNIGSTAQVRFWATTQSLASRYREVTSLSFEPLTYPVNPDLIAAAEVGKAEPKRGEIGASVDNVVRVSLMGGVRREKGVKSFLSKYANRIHSDHELSKKVRLVVQGKKSNLELHWTAWKYRKLIRWLRHPLPSGEYVKEIHRSDIGLLNYDRLTYRNRRAGVLGEFLSAGKPVIVPSQSWLADCLMEPQQEYARSLIQRCGKSAAKPDGNPVGEWQPISIHRKSRYGIIGIEYQPDSKGPGSLDFRFQNRSTGIFREEKIRFCAGCEIEPRKSYFLIRVPKEFHGVEFFCPEPGRLSCFLIESEEEMPISSVGITVQNDDELVEATRELVKHFRHYRCSAQSWALRWQGQHRPQQTLEQLLDTRPERVDDAENKREFRSILSRREPSGSRSEEPEF